MGAISATLITLVAVVSLTSTPATENSELPTENVQLFIVEELPTDSNENELVCDSTVETDDYTANVSSEQGEATFIEEDVDVNPYADLEISESERILMAKMVYGEARGQSSDCMEACALVALNRLLDGSWGTTMTSVLTYRNQFNIAGTYTQECLNAVDAAIAGSDALDNRTDILYFSSGYSYYGTYYKTVGGNNFYAA